MYVTVNLREWLMGPFQLRIVPNIKLYIHTYMWLCIWTYINTYEIICGYSEDSNSAMGIQLSLGDVGTSWLLLFGARKMHVFSPIYSTRTCFSKKMCCSFIPHKLFCLFLPIYIFVFEQYKYGRVFLFQICNITLNVYLY